MTEHPATALRQLATQLDPSTPAEATPAETFWRVLSAAYTLLEAAQSAGDVDDHFREDVERIDWSKVPVGTYGHASTAELVFDLGVYLRSQCTHEVRTLKFGGPVSCWQHSLSAAAEAVQSTGKALAAAAGPSPTCMMWGVEDLTRSMTKWVRAIATAIDEERAAPAPAVRDYETGEALPSES